MKWVIAPLLIAAIGYFIVGPRLVDMQAHPTSDVQIDEPTKPNPS